MQVIPHSLGKSEVLKGGWEVRVPGRAIISFSFGLTGAMVARLPTEQEVVGSSPTLGSFLFRYGVVGNMSGSHPVASGSIPGIGWFTLVLLAQLAEHPLNIRCER